jgi:hypothetical protein
MIGIDPKDIKYDLSPVAEELTKDPGPTVPDQEKRFRAAFPEWIEERYGNDYGGPDYFVWSECWRRVPYELLAQVFTFEELVKMWVSECIESDCGRYFERHEPLLWKIKNSLWQYGCEQGYNKLVAAIKGLKKISTDLPDFDVRITHTRTINTHGSALHDVNLYLDGSFALLLYYKGAHVLTVGFSIARDGILVAQTQLRQKKGNRFLYKLPFHYLEIALAMLYRAFGDTLWLVTGESAVAAIRKAYGPNTPCTMTDEDAERIKALYDRPLEFFCRDLLWVERQGRRYARVELSPCIKTEQLKLISPREGVRPRFNEEAALAACTF